MFVMHPPSVPASVRPNKNILEQKAISVEIPLVTPVSQGAACSEEEKPSITGVAVTEPDDLNFQDYGISCNWEQKLILRPSNIAQSRLGAGWASVFMQTRLEYQDPLRLSGEAHKKAESGVG